MEWRGVFAGNISAYCLGVFSGRIYGKALQMPNPPQPNRKEL